MSDISRIQVDLGTQIYKYWFLYWYQYDTSRSQNSSLQIVIPILFLKYAEENEEADGNGRRLQESTNWYGQRLFANNALEIFIFRILWLLDLHMESSSCKGSSLNTNSPGKVIHTKVSWCFCKGLLAHTYRSYFLYEICN